AGDAGRAVVVWTEDPLVRLEDGIDLALVPDVVAGGNDVDSRGEERIGGRRGEPQPAGDVLAVGGDEVDGPLLAQPRQLLLDGLAPGLADDVADHQHPARARRPWRVSVRGVAEDRATGSRRRVLRHLGN